MIIDNKITSARTIKNFSTLETRFNIKHNNMYIYDKSIYTSYTEKLIIICPIHGEFLQSPNNHLSGKGCAACGQIKSNASRRITLEKFKTISKSVHGNKYNYSSIKEIIPNKKVPIYCPLHGEFEQDYMKHMKGQECRTCGRLKANKSHTKENKDFIEESIHIHGNKYEYAETKYINSKHKVKIKCRIHGVFEQAPFSHLSGRGCKKCGEMEANKKRNNYHGISFYKDKKTILYYVKVENLWKIGICLWKKDIEKDILKGRFGQDIKNGIRVKIIRTRLFEDGSEAYRLEQKILNLNLHKYLGDNILNGGNSELFTKDINPIF